MLNGWRNMNDIDSDSHNEMRCLVEKKIGPIRNAEWFRILTERYWPQDARIAFPADEKAQVEFLAATVREFRAAGYFSFGRAPGPRRANELDQVVGLSPDESLMAAAVSDAMASRATALPAVKYVHENLAMQPDEATRLWSEEDGPLDPGLIDFVVGLALRFGWDPEYAAGFALAGETPLVEPLRSSISIIDVPDEYDSTQIRSRPRILLEADPWISEDTLLKAFRGLRKELIGGDQHRPTPRQLEVYRFVVTRLDERGRPRKDSANPNGSWQGMGRAWNAAHGDDGWAYSRFDQVKSVFDSVNKKLVARQIVLDGEEEISVDARRQVREHGKRYISFVMPDHRSPRDRLPGKPPTKGDGASSAAQYPNQYPNADER
jgi:hypothetical protein